ncbi:hypothetical protein DFR24_1940 [Panacagrimonas perspica]|uniref:Uncharacterized protein n=1 Tax=Panacagrimonas perspica TaxID=381431 RepID=A0A4S3KC24_9GAMM|nr:hypothetical protein [Panacagrimonas perspica]TDU32542.1 hypothetical protein DFR24_1940 [Panacagrimonas perspica]THD05444.1 hypothetical protein B1810_01580 [Panacagrimonas perspica]
MSANVWQRIGIALLLLLQIAPALAAGRFGGIENFDLPRGMQADNIGEWMRIDGIETRAWQFHSTDDADAIAEHFGREWNGRFVRTKAGGWDILSHRQDDWLATVQTGPADALGNRRGFIAIAHRFAPRDPPRPPPGALPSTQLLQDIEAEDHGRRSRTMLLVSDQSAARNLDFYRAHFRTEGFEPLAAGALTRSADGGGMSLVRGNEQLDLAIAERDGRSWIVIVQVLP